MNRGDRFWRAVGGHRQFNSYLAYISLNGMALVLHPSFGEYATAILIALGISGGLATIDARRGTERRATDAPEGA